MAKEYGPVLTHVHQGPRETPCIMPAAQHPAVTIRFNCEAQSTHLPPQERVPGRENQHCHSHAPHAGVPRLDMTPLVCENQTKSLRRADEEPVGQHNLWVKQAYGCGSGVLGNEQLRSLDEYSPPAPATSMSVAPSGEQNSGCDPRASNPNSFNKRVELCRVEPANLSARLSRPRGPPSDCGVLRCLYQHKLGLDNGCGPSRCR